MQNLVTMNSNIFYELDPLYSIGGWMAMSHILGYSPRESEFIKVYMKNVSIATNEKERLEELIGYRIIIINSHEPFETIKRTHFVSREKIIADKLNSIFTEGFPRCKDIYDLYFLLYQRDYNFPDLKKYLDIKNPRILEPLDEEYFDKFQNEQRLQINYTKAIDTINLFVSDMKVRKIIEI